jgi:hypothetical protein
MESTAARIEKIKTTVGSIDAPRIGATIESTAPTTKKIRTIIRFIDAPRIGDLST